MIIITVKQLNEKIENLNSRPCELVNEEEARELLQAFFDQSLMEMPTESLKPAFSLLRKINFNSNEPAQQINFTDLISTLTFCFDLIYAEKDKRILFTADGEDLTVCAKPEKISLSFLNILFNLIDSFNSTYYFVCMERKSEKAIIKIEFEHGDSSAVSSVFNRLNNDYIYSIGGCVLFINESNIMQVVISVPVNLKSGLPEYQTPSIEALLFDRLSVVYSSLF